MSRTGQSPEQKCSSDFICTKEPRERAEQGEQTGKEPGNTHEPTRSLLFASAALERLASSVVISLLAVYLSEKGFSPSLAATTAGVVLGASYLTSVLAARFAGNRWTLPVSTTLLCVAFLALYYRVHIVALTVLPLAIGTYRPAIAVQIENRRGSLSATQAMARYLFLLNFSYLLGPVLADLLRMRHGWAGVFTLCLGAAVAALGLSVRAAQKTKVQLSSAEATPNAQLAAALSMVAVYYGLQQQAVGPLALACENESTPLLFLNHSVRLHAGALAGLHGAFVLFGMALMALVRTRLPWALATTLGLSVSSLGFLLLALFPYPISQSWLVLAFLLLSIGETIVAPGVMVLGATLSGFKRSLYWLAAGLGYWGGGALSALWGQVTHRSYLLFIVCCCLVSAGVLFRRTLGGWAGVQT